MRYAALPVFTLLALSGCKKSTLDGECLRASDWRDTLELQGSSEAIFVTESCVNELVVEEIELVGAGFSAELPEVGDIIPEGDWIIDLSFSAEEPGSYSGVLYVSAEGLLDDGHGKEFIAVVD